MPEEIKQEVVVKTQKYLGKYVKKPPLSDKLLRKPPFRFLHDVINTVIKETGFLKGLFSEEELNSENVKERDAKVAFLSKLIDAVKVITNTELSARPGKIVAGLEPTETNLLLQTIGKAIEKKIDSSEYINQLNGGQVTNKKTKKSTDKTEKSKKPSKTPNEEKIRTTPKTIEKQSSNETPKSTDRDKTKAKSKPKASKSKPDPNKEKTRKKEKPKEKAETPPTLTTEANDNNPQVLETHDSKTNKSPPEETPKTTTEPQEERKSPVTVEPPESEPRKRTASASRPKSARPKSGDLKEPAQVLSRPKSSLRPPSVRPPSARPGAPRLRPDSAFPVKEVVPMGKINVIVENYDKDDDEETVIIQSNPEIVEEHGEDVEVPVDNKGHLVEQILEQISESDGNKSGVAKVENEWQDVLQGKDATTKETNGLRSLIQSLTKTANPLGKLLNYLHEDIDAMHAELESWTNTKRQLFDEIAKQKKISIELNKPLVLQLEHLTEEIKKMEEEIVNTRSNILRNDVKIKELLAK